MSSPVYVLVSGLDDKLYPVVLRTQHQDRMTDWHYCLQAALIDVPHSDPLAGHYLATLVWKFPNAGFSIEPLDKNAEDPWEVYLVSLSRRKLCLWAVHGDNVDLGSLLLLPADEETPLEL